MKATPPSSSTAPPESTFFSPLSRAWKVLIAPLSSRLKGKTALVTGGDSGIGRAAAIMFAMEGARGVTITYLPQEKPDAEDAAKAIEAAGSKALIVECNLENEADCRKIVDEHIKTFGTLNILVNNASKQMCVFLAVGPEKACGY
jgi:NAD(P)-dependent dehydrogenase (short-subunit alcohol dehydrogenase family)